MSLILLMCVCVTEPLFVKEDGRLGGEALFLGAGTTLAADDSGRIYLLDPSSYQVQVFDPDLKSLFHFGRRGKGPGEFEEPKVIALTPSGQPAVFDPSLKRLTVFSPQGEVVRTSRLDAGSVSIYHPAILADSVAFLSARSHGGKPVYDLSVYGDGVANLVRIPVRPMDWSKSSEPSFWVNFLESEFELLGRGLPVMCGLDENRLVFARSNDYRLHFVDADGVTVSEVKHKHKPKAFTSDSSQAAFESIWNRLTVDPFLFNNMPRSVFERAAKKAVPPDTLPAIQAMTRYGDGFAVLADYDAYRGEGRIDLFGSAGNFLGSASYAGRVDYFTGNREHLFVVGADDEGDISIQRLRMK